MKWRGDPIRQDRDRGPRRLEPEGPRAGPCDITFLTSGLVKVNHFIFGYETTLMLDVANLHPVEKSPKPFHTKIKIE